MKIAPKTTISLGGKPKVSEPAGASEPVENHPVSVSASEKESVEASEVQSSQSPKFVEGVDIIAPAKVIGTE